MALSLPGSMFTLRSGLRRSLWPHVLVDPWHFAFRTQMGLNAVPLATVIGGTTTAFLLEQLCRLDAAAGPDGGVLLAATETPTQQPERGGRDPVDQAAAQTAGSPVQSVAARPCRQRHQHFWRDR